MRSDTNDTTKNKTNGKIINQICLYVFMVVLFSVVVIINNTRLINPFMKKYKSNFVGWKSPLTTSSSSFLFLSQIDSDDNTTLGSKSKMVLPKSGERKNGDNNYDDDDDHHHPWLIVHVGPPKTGTTTIQDSFEKMAYRLAIDDNYFYVGQTLEQSSEINLGPTMNNENLTIFRKRDLIDRRSSEFLETIQHHHTNKRNVVISSEFYTSTFHKGKISFDDIFLRKKNQITIANTSSNSNKNDDNNDSNNNDNNNNNAHIQQQRQQKISTENLFAFKVKIIVGYRHFFYWLPSYYYQRHIRLVKDIPNKLTKIGDNKKYLYKYKGYYPGIVEYIEWFLRDLVQYDDDVTDKNNMQNYINFTSYEGIFVDNIRKELQKKVHGSIWSYLMWSSYPELYDRVDVFDMHQQEYSATTTTTTTNNNNNGDDNDSNNSSKIKPEQNLFANFVCQMLPSASNTCRYLIEETSDNDFQKRKRKKHLTSTADIFRIIQAFREKKLSLPEFSDIGSDPKRIDINHWIERWYRPIWIRTFLQSVYV